MRKWNKTREIPSSLVKAFYAVVDGHDYSHKLSRKLGISQPSALELLKRLAKKNFITPGKLEGRMLRYHPNWKYIADSWIGFLDERLNAEIEAKAQISSGTARRNIRTGQMEMVSPEKYSNEQKMLVRSELANLKTNKAFLAFVERYFAVLGKVGYSAILPEAFVLFAYEVPVEKLVPQYSFVGLLKPKSSVLGRRIEAHLLK